MDEPKKDIKTKNKPKKEKKPKKKTTKKRKSTQKLIQPSIQETQSSKFVSNLPFGKPPIGGLSAFGGGGMLGGSALTQPFGAIFSREISPNKGTPQNPVNVFPNATPTAINGNIPVKEYSPEEDNKTQKQIQNKLSKLFKDANVDEVKSYLDTMYRDDDLGKYYLDTINEPATKIGVIKRLARYATDYPKTFMISELEDYFNVWVDDYINDNLGSNSSTISSSTPFSNITSPSNLSPSMYLGENPSELSTSGFTDVSSNLDVSVQDEDE